MRWDRDLDRRTGFSLIEALFVASMVGVLVALLLPAVQAAREAARRARCLNQMRQLTVALNHYNLVHGTLPSGTVDPGRPIASAPNGYHYGWIVQVLPYFEADIIYDGFNFALDVYHPNHLTSRMTVLNTLICASDRYVRASGQPALSRYAGCHHHAEAPIDITNTGMLYLNSAIRPERIPDGLSQTILFGEKLLEPGDLGWASGTRATLRNTGTAPNLMGFRVGSRIPGLTVVPTTPANPAFVGGYSSRHPGGVNMAMADGSAKFIKDTISWNVYEALGDRRDEQMIDSQTY